MSKRDVKMVNIYVPDLFNCKLTMELQTNKINNKLNDRKTN